MNREIKFRAKRLEDNTQWIYGSLMQYNDGSCYIGKNSEAWTDGGFHNYYFNEVALVDEETIGQYTGLKDKNGVEIYEGDIIGCHNPDIKHLIFYNEKQGRFMAALNGDIENDYVGVCGLDDSRWNASKEVVGNIYDNKDLL